MPMLGPHMGTTMAGVLAGNGFVGPQLPTMTLACGTGSCLSVVGKTFQSQDTGTVPGIGVGVGVGLTGIVSSAVQTSCLSAHASKGFQVTPQAIDLYSAYGQALQAEAMLATLTSQDTPVFAGVGVITPGSIPVDASSWASNIQTAGAAFAGEKWPDLCSVFAQGGVDGFATATGQLVIAGSPTAPATSPGTGPGSGVIA